MRLSTRETVGERLRRARSARGASLDDAAQATRIARHHLEALESDAPPEEFPEPWYARTFLREYARYLGLRSRPLVEQYQAAFPRREVAPIGLLPLERRRGGWVKPVLIALSVAVLGALVAVTVRSSLGPEEDTETPSFPSPASPSAPVVESPTTEPAAPRGLVLRVRVVDGPCWVRVARGERVLLEGTQQPGFGRTFRAPRRLEIVLGNAGAARLVANGRPLDLQLASGEVLRAGVVLRDDRPVLVPLVPEV